MTDHSVDVVVSGGGIAGMVTAIAFAQAGFDTLCVDPQPPVTSRAADGADLRTTAFLQPARNFLDELGIWQYFSPETMPLDIMRIVDAGGAENTPRIRVEKEFNSAEVSDLPFGWNIPNTAARAALMTRMDDLENLTFLTEHSCERLFTREGKARVTLSNRDRFRAKLVVAADGRNSPMREQSGIPVQTTRFGQKALAFAVSHPIPHENVSTEIHRTGGPFTLVPLPDHDGMPCSAIVWMETGPNARALFELDVPEFEAAMTERSCNLLGPLTLLGRRSLWPIISQLADRLTGQRVALVAEAAHVVPPIGAQGLNMSLADIRSLVDLAVKDPANLGSRAMLDAYHKSRYADLKLRVQGITMLNRASMFDDQPLRDLRATGLNALYALPQVRKTLMQMGLGLK